MINVITLVLGLLGNVLAAAKVGGAAPEVVAAIQAAIDALSKVHGSDVTFQQLEGLRVKATW